MASSRHWFETVAEAQRRAKKRLPKSVYMALVAGSEQGITLNDNVDAFGELGFRPHVADLPQNREQATTVLGQDISFPVIISPTGVQAVDPEGEVAVARAAAAAGTAIGLSSFASRSVEDVAAANDKVFFQMYWVGTRERILQRVERARKAGAKALIVTLDWSFAPGATGAARPSRRSSTSRRWRGSRPRCCAGPGTCSTGLRSGEAARPHLPQPGAAPARSCRRSSAPTANGWAPRCRPGRTSGGCARSGAARSWSRGSCIPTTRGGPSTPAPPRSRCPTTAATTSTAPRPRSARCPAVVDAVGDQIEVLLDGGIRRGSDVVKALALGAKAVMIGRAYLWGMAAGGEAGVANVLQSCAAASTRRCSAWAARRSTNWSATT